MLPSPLARPGIVDSFLGRGGSELDIFGDLENKRIANITDSDVVSEGDVTTEARIIEEARRAITTGELFAEEKPADLEVLRQASTKQEVTNPAGITLDDVIREAFPEVEGKTSLGNESDQFKGMTLDDLIKLAVEGDKK